MMILFTQLLSKMKLQSISCVTINQVFVKTNTRLIDCLCFSCLHSFVLLLYQPYCFTYLALVISHLEFLLVYFYVLGLSAYLLSCLFVKIFVYSQKTLLSAYLRNEYLA